MKRTILTYLFAFYCIATIAQVKVVFKIDSYHAVKDKPAMYLAGDFNGWNPADNAWKMQGSSSGPVLIKNMLAGKISFKVTRGNWDKVECDSTGKAIVNREYNIVHDTTIVLNVAAWQDYAPAQEVKRTASANVHIISEKFDMPQLGRQRRIWIYLPADYETSEKKYPVLYMNDGQNLFDEATGNFGEWSVDETLDKLPVKKQCIVVGIDNGGNERLAEYSPYPSKYAKEAQGDKYIEFLVNTLKPYIDAHYRTKKDARHTAIAGSSMGGLISFYAILKHPEIFGKAGVFSPAFWINPEIFQYAQQTSLNKTSAFYFTCGDQEGSTMTSDMQKIYDIIKPKSKTAAQSPVVVLKGERHNEKQWRTSFPAFYEWLSW
ncbi:alpha/beta hydrolase [Mucilaginibacter limnophilus]|uniref:Alpha/beta hydrolase n=1 Tax=Mucilaginibacter limnophilus TaxID=1932778 RepID=A0A3S2XYG0_9SPHI|nr:alpha/beta hydrolase-fold protein [Mucilaginibacter limnophilus]RVT98028.1 alpha/beta hydrolase [Mucilaginibacter limnophilus]